MSGLLTRFEPQNNARKIAMIALWVLVHVLLILKFTNLYWADSLSVEHTPLVVVTVCACLVCEFLLLSLFAGAAKGALARERRRGRGILALLLLFPVYLYFVAILVSWSLVWLGIGFLDCDLLRAFFVDVGLVWKHFTSLEFFVALGAMLAPLPLVWLMLLISPVRNARSFSVAGIVAAVAFAISFYGLQVAPASMSAADRSGYRASLGRSLLPSLSLLWANLLYRDPEPETPGLREELHPLYSLEDYAKQVSPEERPNIILVIIEALRSDMVQESVGAEAVMPNLRRLADAGTVALQVPSPSSESAYSMTSILTGLYPMKFGSRDSFANLSYPYVRIYDVLSAAGYRTGFFSSANENWQNMIRVTKSPRLDAFFHAESADAAKRFGEHDDAFEKALREGALKTGKLDDEVTIQEAAKWILESAGEKPFFEVLSLQTSHFPYEQSSKVKGVFTPNELTEKQRGEISFLSYPPELSALMKNRYRNSLRYIDGLLEQLLSAVEQRRLSSRTIFIVTGDHGELFGEHGFVTHATSLYSVTTSIPVVLYQLGTKIPLHSGKKQLLDLAPTILDLAALPAHENFQGRSMLAKGPPSAERPAYSSVEGVTMKDAVSYHGMRYIFDRRQETFELFDSEKDPGEQRNLAAENNPAAPCLKKLLENFRARQLKYYGSADLYSKFFPPKQEDLPRECENLKRGSYPS
jgi:arylsulfatase A-like enzyme